VLDTDVLDPFEVRDTLLLAANDGLFQARWSDDFLTEMRRNLVQNGATSEQQASRLIEQMALTFPEADVQEYRQLIVAMMCS